MNKNIYLKINCKNLGDNICSTPVIRKLYNLYNKKIIVINDFAEVFNNSPYIKRVISSEFFDISFLNSEDEFFETFLLAGQKNQFNIERKFNTFDIRQIHAVDLGFYLLPEEMRCDYFPSTYNNPYNLPDKYIVLHTAKNWPNRTWSQSNWQKIINYLKEKSIFTVLIGKKVIEKESHIINKDFYHFDNLYGLNLIDKTDLSDCWHIINNSNLFITFDTGPLHLAGTTDVEILQLGSAKDPRLVAPYRNNGTQNYKYNFIKGSCNLFCTNNLKYSIKEWNTINCVPPLINCLENKKTFECQPSVDQILEYLEKIL